MLQAWIFLLLAICCEVFGVSVMNYSEEGSKIITYGFMFVMLGISYYFMSLAICRINVGTAYAIWEVVGLSLIAVISIFIFGNHLNTQEYIGLALALVGIILVNLGEEHLDTDGVGDLKKGNLDMETSKGGHL